MEYNNNGVLFEKIIRWMPVLLIVITAVFVVIVEGIIPV